MERNAKSKWFVWEGLANSYEKKRRREAETLLCLQRLIWSRLWFFQWSCMDVRVGLWGNLSPQNWAFELWCWRRLLRVSCTARRSNQFILKETSPGCSLEGWCWSWNSNTLATSCEELTYWKRPWCWEGLEAGGEGDDRGWYCWMASLTWWAWVWVNSGSWWWTGRPRMLQFMGSQRVGHNWVTELNLTVQYLRIQGIMYPQTHFVFSIFSNLVNLVGGKWYLMAFSLCFWLLVILSIFFVLVSHFCIL